MPQVQLGLDCPATLGVINDWHSIYFNGIFFHIQFFIEYLYYILSLIFWISSTQQHVKMSQRGLESEITRLKCGYTLKKMWVRHAKCGQQEVVNTRQHVEMFEFFALFALNPNLQSYIKLWVIQYWVVRVLLLYCFLFCLFIVIMMQNSSVVIC